MDMQRIISKHQHTDGLIALFPQHQMSGDISYDFGPNQGHGTLSNVSSRYSDHSISKGHFMNASGYDKKASSWNNILTPELIASFDGNHGSLVVFCKLDESWASGQEGYVLMLKTDDGDTIEVYKRIADNSFWVRYNPGSGHSRDLTLATTDWFCIGMTWNNEVADDDADDEVFVFVDGIFNARLVTFPLMTGTLDTAIIGAHTTEPAKVWDGGIGLVALYDKALSSDEMYYLSKP